jgi:hypothetical protein
VVVRLGEEGRERLRGGNERDYIELAVLRYPLRFIFGVREHLGMVPRR